MYSIQVSIIIIAALVFPFVIGWMIDHSAKKQKHRDTDYIDCAYRVGSDHPIYRVIHPDGSETWTDNRDAAPHMTRPNARINRGLREYIPSAQRMSAIVDEFHHIPTAEEAAEAFNRPERWRHDAD